MALDRSALKGYPEAVDFLEKIDDASNKLHNDLEAARNLEGAERAVHIGNCWIRFCLSIGKASEQFGLAVTEADIKAWLIENYYSHDSNRIMSVGEERAIAVSIAYSDGHRLLSSGEQDTPMQAAMKVASLMERYFGLLPIGRDSENTMHIAMVQEEHDDTDRIGTIDKSIRRFRKKVRGAEVVWLNRETCQFEFADAEDKLLQGLPKRQGRPQKGSRKLN